MKFYCAMDPALDFEVDYRCSSQAATMENKDYDDYRWTMADGDEKKCPTCVNFLARLVHSVDGGSGGYLRSLLANESRIVPMCPSTV